MARKIAKQLGLVTWRLLLAVGGGWLAGFALPRAGQWWVIFISVAMLLLAIKDRGFWRAYGLGVLGGIFFYASQSPWMTAYLGPVPWLALATLQGLIFGFGMAFSALVWRNLKSLPITAFALAAIWVAREWVAGHWPYGGYQWSRLAQTQADTWLAKWAYFGGLSWVSFVVAFASAAVVLMIIRRDFKNWITVGSVSFALIFPAIFTVPVSATGSVTVAGIQGNANAGLFSNEPPGSNLDKQLRETYRAAQDPAFGEVDFIVWPENASDLDPTRIEAAKEAVLKLVADLNKPILLGTVNWRGDEVFNTILQYNPGEGQVDYYDKQRPVPFAEYVPDREFWNLLAPDLIGLITTGYSFGQKSGIFDIAGVKAGSLICFEITIDDLMHKLVQEDAEVLISQANNADFGTTDETFQQAQLVKLQAIATGRSIIHISTVGTSFVTHPNGSVHSEIEPFKPGYYIAEVPLSNAVTPAEMFFGWSDWLALIATLGFVVLALWRRKKV